MENDCRFDRIYHESSTVLQIKTRIKSHILITNNCSPIHDPAQDIMSKDDGIGIVIYDLDKNINFPLNIL